MALVYAVIARGQEILCDYSAAEGNYASVTSALLERIEQGTASAGVGEQRATFVYDAYHFHSLQRRGTTYICLAESQFGRGTAFAFLDDIARRFESLYGEDASASAAREFSRILADQMREYSSGKGNKFAALENDISQVRSIMVNNIESILQRGDRLETIVGKTESLSQASFAFKKRSTALKRQMWWKNTRLMGMAAVASVLTIYFLGGAACGFPGWYKCFGSKNN